MEGFGRKGLITRGMKNATLYRSLQFFFPLFSLSRVEEVEEVGKKGSTKRALVEGNAVARVFRLYPSHVYSPLSATV